MREGVQLPGGCCSEGKSEYDDASEATRKWMCSQCKKGPHRLPGSFAMWFPHMYEIKGLYELGLIDRAELSETEIESLLAMKGLL